MRSRSKRRAWWARWVAILGCAVGPVVPAVRGQVTTVAFIPRAEEVDASIERGLHFLLESQARDGTFGGRFGKSTGVVSLCGMAFLAKGHTPGNGPYGEAIDRCIDYVLASQQKDGMLAVGQSSHGPMYSHNISTLFLSEVSGMATPERQVRIHEVLGRAVSVLLKAQKVQKKEPFLGGWRYKIDSIDSDLSCSGWALMALRSSRLNGAPVPEEAIEQARKYLLRNHNVGTGAFGYMDTTRNATTLTGAAVLCLSLTGSTGDEVLRKAGDYMMNVYRELPRQEFPFYGLYYNAQGAFQLGGRYWERFATWMYDTWLPKQSDDGSWAMVPNCWMIKHGKDDYPYVTAMTVLSFAVPYRQLPIYQRDETVDEEPE